MGTKSDRISDLYVWMRTLANRDSLKSDLLEGSFVLIWCHSDSRHGFRIIINEKNTGRKTIQRIINRRSVVCINADGAVNVNYLAIQFSAFSSRHSVLAIQFSHSLGFIQFFSDGVFSNSKANVQTPGDNHILTRLS